MGTKRPWRLELGQGGWRSIGHLSTEQAARNKANRWRKQRLFAQLPYRIVNTETGQVIDMAPETTKAEG